MRFKVARKIVERAADHGIPRDAVVIDPIIMPIGAIESAGTPAFRLVRRPRGELGVNTCRGASAISFGLPNRPVLNVTFLAMAIANGMTSATTNPIEAEIKQMILAADVVMRNDPNCRTWIPRMGRHSESGPGDEQKLSIAWRRVDSSVLIFANSLDGHR